LQPEHQTLEAAVDADLDTLATALYVRTDDVLKTCPERVPWRPAVGISPELSDAELLTLGQLDLERHGGHAPGGVIARIIQRIDKARAGPRSALRRWVTPGAIRLLRWVGDHRVEHFEPSRFADLLASLRDHLQP
jgi:hypothetical protein